MNHQKLFRKFIDGAEEGERFFDSDSGWSTVEVAMAMTSALQEIETLHNVGAHNTAMPGLSVDDLMQHMEALCDRLETQAGTGAYSGLQADQALKMATEQMRTLLMPFQKLRSLQLQSPGR